MFEWHNNRLDTGDYTKKWRGKEGMKKCLVQKIKKGMKKETENEQRNT